MNKKSLIKRIILIIISLPFAITYLVASIIITPIIFIIMNIMSLWAFLSEQDDDLESFADYLQVCVLGSFLLPIIIIESIWIHWWGFKSFL